MGIYKSTMLKVLLLSINLKLPSALILVYLSVLYYIHEIDLYVKIKLRLSLILNYKLCLHMIYRINGMLEGMEF